MASYTEAAKAELARGMSELKIIDTVELYNSEIPSFYIVNSDKATTVTLENGSSVSCTPLNLSVVQPPADNPEMTLSVECSELLTNWVLLASSTKKTSVLKYRYYLSTNLSAPATVEPIEMNVGDISLTDLVVQIKAQFLNLKKHRGPSLRFTNELAPSLTF